MMCERCHQRPVYRIVRAPGRTPARFELCLECLSDWELYKGRVRSCYGAPPRPYSFEDALFDYLKRYGRPP